VRRSKQPQNYLHFSTSHICHRWYHTSVNTGAWHLVLILRFLPILIVVALAVLLARRARPQKETVETNPADMTSLLIALSGLIGLFVLFVGIAEFITRM
jgi:nitrate reductase gamma subunit